MSKYWCCIPKLAQTTMNSNGDIIYWTKTVKMSFYCNIVILGVKIASVMRAMKKPNLSKFFVSSYILLQNLLMIVSNLVDTIFPPREMNGRRLEMVLLFCTSRGKLLEQSTSGSSKLEKLNLPPSNLFITKA